MTIPLPRTWHQTSRRRPKTDEQKRQGKPETQPRKHRYRLDRRQYQCCTQRAGHERPGAGSRHKGRERPGAQPANKAVAPGRNHAQRWQFEQAGKVQGNGNNQHKQHHHHRRVLQLERPAHRFSTGTQGKHTRAQRHHRAHRANKITAGLSPCLTGPRS